MTSVVPLLATSVVRHPVVLWAVLRLVGPWAARPLETSEVRLLAVRLPVVSGVPRLVVQWAARRQGWRSPRLALRVK